MLDTVKPSLAGFFAGSNPMPPAHLGTRYDMAGNFLIEPGNTIVSHLVNGSPSEAVVLEVRERMLAMPDADRLAIVDERGSFIGEEYTLVLAALRMLQRHGSGALATNLSTSRMIDDVAALFPGSHVVRTAVGEANVVAGLRPVNGILGGEGNGGTGLDHGALQRSERWRRV